mgnify:CR=1 FL=1
MENCPICQDELDIRVGIKVLDCSHKMHKNCYRQFICNCSQKKCPICRIEIVDNNAECGFCLTRIDSTPEKCEALQSEECGCLFHYNCVKSGRSIECKNCNRMIDTEKVIGLTYVFLDNAFRNWVGRYYVCMQNGCSLNGNPRFDGYCIKHKRSEASDNAIILSLKYFVKYVYESDGYSKYLIFLKLIQFMNTNYKNANIDSVDLLAIRFKVDNFIYL